MPSKKVNSALAMFEAAGRAPAKRAASSGPTAAEMAIINRWALFTAESWLDIVELDDEGRYDDADEPETDEIEALSEGEENGWREATSEMMTLARPRRAYVSDPDTDAREEQRVERFWPVYVASVKRQARERRAASRKKGSRR